MLAFNAFPHVGYPALFLNYRQPRLQPVPYPPVLLGQCVPGDANVVGCGVGLPVKTLHYIGVKEAVPAAGRKQPVYSSYAQPGHVAWARR